ncbi:MAG: DUF488 family protein [Planctomycetota bacterium]
MKLFTIGFTKKSAEEFFTALGAAGVRRIIDIRLNNTSQLAAFAKRDDLIYFLREICAIDYVHRPDLAPTPEIFEAYKKHKGTWERFEEDFKALMRQRRIETALEPELLDQACLLCSEPTADYCHRRLVGEYLVDEFSGLDLCHL